MKSGLKFFVLLFPFAATCYAQDVIIPDANFKAALVGNTSINTNMDTEIQETEAEAFTGPLNVSTLNISDLTGIEAFTALTNLDCSINSLTNLDLSSNTALTVLKCYFNQLTTLDVSANTALTYLDCSINDLTSLDVSGNTALLTLSVSENDIESIDVSENTALTALLCNTCGLTSLDVSSNTMLAVLGCAYNPFTNLDLSENSALASFSCANSALQTLNVKNGNNDNVYFFSAINNPDLNCIQVDNALYSEANWSNVDPGVSFSENCFAGIADLSETRFSVQPNPASDYIVVSGPQEISSVRIYSLAGELIQTVSETSFSIQNLPAGAYIISIETEDELIQSRFVRY